jgi:3-dehydroquinate dehydratase-1
MPASKKANELVNGPMVVGTIPSSAALQLALRLKPGAVDLFELRVDHFAGDPEPLLRAAARLRAPRIVTVRHRAEGGAAELSAARRRELFGRFLPLAQFIDIELRSLHALAGVADDARLAGAGVIVSAHFFKNTPPLARLKALRERARVAGADIFKIATLTRTLGNVLSLARLLVPAPRVETSVMGMGECGKLSRLLLACAGSRLNYGYLDAVQVPGQWPAPLLKQRLGELA